MKAKNRPRFDVDALRAEAGDKVFARGEAYHGTGQVEILDLEPGRVLARVTGTDDYRIVLTGRGRKIGGECSCPAFSDWGFCKHMVATALAANASGPDGESEAAGALARIRRHLKAKGVDALVAMIVDLAERDTELFRKLEMASATASADDKALEARLRKAIDGATRTRGFVDYREASGWAAGVAEALDALADLASGSRAGVALKLVEHAIGRIERAIEEIDDSDGHCGELLDRAREVHIVACKAARPDSVKLARDLFAREMEGAYDTFHDAAARYADVLGVNGLAEFRRLAVEAWEKLPPRTGPREFSADYAQLETMLDFFAERDGDVEARISLRAKNLSSPWNYLRLAEFCLAQGRKDEALRRAEEGLWVFDDERPDERLVLFVVDLLSKAGRDPDAVAVLWRAFEKVPTLDLYRRLRRLGGKPMRERAISHLKARLAKGKFTPWSAPADLLVEVLMEEKMFDEAWATLREHGASGGLEESLARASEATHPAAAIAVYAKRVERLASAGGNGAYAEAAKLIARMAALRAPSEQSAYLTSLKHRFRLRRNFMKLLG